MKDARASYVFTDSSDSSRESGKPKKTFARSSSFVQTTQTKLDFSSFVKSESKFGDQVSE